MRHKCIHLIVPVLSPVPIASCVVRIELRMEVSARSMFSQRDEFGHKAVIIIYK